MEQTTENGLSFVYSNFKNCVFFRLIAIMTIRKDLVIACKLLINNGWAVFCHCFDDLKGIFKDLFCVLLS